MDLQGPWWKPIETDLGEVGSSDEASTLKQKLLALANQEIQRKDLLCVVVSSWLVYNSIKQPSTKTLL